MIYISGKITNDENYKEKFAKAKERLIATGLLTEKEIINPAEIDLPQNCMHEDYMHICLHLLDKCHLIFMLSDWEESKGACIEYGYARAKNMNVLFEKI